MRSRLAFARAVAREAREALGGKPSDLLSRLREMLEQTHHLEVIPVNGEKFLRGSRGELVPAEGCLYYDSRLDQDPKELLEVLAHEFGHLLLHHDHFVGGSSDLIRGSAFLNNGAAALSRYSPRSQYESEASAFASEFICAARECFRRWQDDTGITVASLGAEFHATPSLVRLQLAEGLFEFVAGECVVEQNGSELECNGEQEVAAITCGVPLLLDAGPGTGKTKTLVRRVGYLINEKQIAPENILVLTFSNEAAGELQQRISRLLGEEIASRMLISTFHGFGMITLDALGHFVGLDVDYSLLDEICQEELVSEILGTVDCEAVLNIKNIDETAASVSRTLGYLKDRLTGPAQLKAAIDQWAPLPDEREPRRRSQAILRIFERYEEEKAKRQKVDFADLIRLPIELLQSNPELREQVRSDFSWVLVDEYQDVSRATAILLREICGEDNPPWVVGDARQAIYRFRGAAPENVYDFQSDFPNAQRFQLTENYRSSPQVIEILNRLAADLDDERYPTNGARWKPGRGITSRGKQPVVLAKANSDHAEREGVVRVIEQWLEDGVPAEEVAVLARRNLDVRNLAIELKKKGIRAVTSGLLTAEGAGGDLAGVLTAVDHQPALARVAYGLFGKSVSPQTLNEAIKQILAIDQKAVDAIPTWSGPPEIQDLADQLWRIFRGLREHVYSGDGWTVLCDFLFFLSPYLRDLIGHSESAESAVRLEEVLSALSLTASYRYTHPHVQPLWSRLGLSEKMRDLVTESAPGLVPPRKQPGAVRVMTCHASKGLEFPNVAVVGQSLADIRPTDPCLPPSLRPDANEDLLQAESLLFVGLSRAERGAVISFASSASGSPRSRARKVPPLLSKLELSRLVPIVTWTSEAPLQEEMELTRIWGGDSLPEFSPYSLGKKSCKLRIYLEEQLGARFRGRERSLYPEFISVVRRTLTQIVARAITTRQQVSEGDAVAVAESEWPADRHKDHQHIRIYRPRLLRWARSFANAFSPPRALGAKLEEKPIQVLDGNGVSRTVKLPLIAHFQDTDGERIAVVLQVSGVNEKTNVVNWSDLADYERLPFVLIHDRYGSVEPLVFFGEEGKLCSFHWHERTAQAAISRQAEETHETARLISSGKFRATVQDWVCDRCACRTICPAWIGAAPKLD